MPQLSACGINRELMSYLLSVSHIPNVYTQPGVLKRIKKTEKHSLVYLLKRHGFFKHPVTCV